MAPLSKSARCIILAFFTYGTHLDASNKKVDMKLEMKKKKIKAAGEILAEIWFQSIINDHPVKAAYIDPQEHSIDTPESERWKRVHVQQSQYMLQIVKCNDQSCCKLRTNYFTYFPERFLLPSVPLKSTVDGSEMSLGMFGSLFQAIFLAKYADKCFEEFFPSLQKVGKKGKNTIQNGYGGSVVNTTQPSRQ